MKKLLILLLFVFPAIANAQYNYKRYLFDTLEIANYGTIEGYVVVKEKQMDERLGIYRQQWPEKPKKCFYFQFTNEKSGEKREFILEYKDLKSIVECISSLKKIAQSPTPPDLTTNEIKVQTLTPPLKLKGKGMKGTYTTEYFTREYKNTLTSSSHVLKIGFYTNAAKKTVWYFMFGKSDTEDEAKKWNVLQTSPDKISHWLNQAWETMMTDD